MGWALPGVDSVLIANDESVLYQVPVSWHSSSRDISNGALYGASAIAGGIYLTGLFTKDEHQQEVGIRTAEATVDSVIMYGAMKAIFQRQRPFSGEGEGNFFAGNWTNGSFPSGHAMLPGPSLRPWHINTIRFRWISRCTD